MLSSHSTSSALPPPSSRPVPYPISPPSPPPGPTLQKLATESKVALVLIKHLPLTEPRHVADVVEAVSSAVASPVWIPRL